MDGEQDSSEWTGAATLVGLPPRGCHHVLGCRLDGSSHLGHLCYCPSLYGKRRTSVCVGLSIKLAEVKAFRTRVTK